MARLLGFAAVGAILTGIVLYRRPDMSWRSLRPVEPWLLIAAGVAVLAIAGATNGLGPDGYGDPGRLAFVGLAAYPFLTVGLVRLVTLRLPDRDADVLVQAGLVATVFGLALWAVIAPERNLASLGDSLLLVARPALDLMLLTITVRLLLLPGERLPVYRALALAVGYLLGADLAALLSAVNGWSSDPDIVGMLLAGSFVCWAMAALHRSMTELADPLTGDPPTFSPGHFVLIQLGMLAAPAVIALHALRHTAIPAPTAVGAGFVSAVLAPYLGSLLWRRGANERRAHHDELTGLPNRTLFADRLNRALAHARRNDLPVGVMFVDLDRFKQINDGHGHGAGDELLRQVARRLESCVRAEDTVARIGGDEFALLMPHMSGIDGAVTVAERVLASFVTPVMIGDQQVVVTPSLGISVYPQDGTDPQDLIEGADAAMYRAKEQGRNNYEIFSPALRTAVHERLAFESDLHHALDRNEFVLYYQPKVDLETGAVTGAEALVRWQHPERGLLFPGDFVPVAERSGQVVALGEYVIATACEQLVAWRNQGLPPLRVSVNVSARQLRHGLVDYVAAALRYSGVDPSQLELELTESAALESLEVTVEVLQAVRAMGVACSIDDFGTGYCGLSYLSRLPIDCLKIDKSFIQAMTGPTDPIVTAILALGHSLNLIVTAEGVETAEQLGYLTERGCDEVQGYLFSKPIPAADFARLLLDSVPGGPGRLPVRLSALTATAPG